MQRGSRAHDPDLRHEGPRRKAGPGHPLPRRRQRRLDDHRAALSVQDWLRLRSELILKNEKRTEQAAGCVGRYLPRSPSYAPMAGMKRISASGRALLVAGALLVFYSLFYAPWFVVAVIGSVFTEAGARLPHVVRAHYEVPTATEWEDPVEQ